MGIEKTKRRPDVFSYHDYRLFLKEWVKWVQEQRQDYSLRALAKEAGFSCGYLPLILGGRRKLTEKAMRKLFPVLHLPPRERYYFELLVRVEDGSPTEKVEAMEQMQRMRAYRKANPRETEVYRYLTRWFYVALRELAALPDFQADPKWIYGRLRGGLSYVQIEQAMIFLQENGFLKEVGGRVCPVEKDIRCIGQVFGPALRQFHHQMLSTSLQALDESSGEMHLILGHTTAISTKKLPQVKEILQNALKQIERLGQEDKEPDSVYHIGLLAAPLTR